jgi:hypothetical protein
MPEKGKELEAAQRYHEWLYHNELELALDELEGLGEESQVDQNFWEFLRLAAIEMKRNDHAIRYQQKQTH